MALLFLEGFEGYNNVDEMMNVQGPVSWISYARSHGSGNDPLVYATTVRTTQPTAANSRSLFLDSYGSYGVQIIMGLPNITEIIMGFAVHTPNYGATAPIVRFGDDTGASEGICLGRNAVNQLTVSVPNGSGLPGTVLGTSTNSLNINNWTYVEIKIVCHATLGSVEVRIDDSTEINLSGINTATNITSGYNFAIFSVARNGNTTDYILDDLYVCDTSGADNNDFLGPIAVYSLLPNGAGSSTQMTPVGEASNYLAVDDPVLDTANYVESGTNGNLDLYSFEDLPAGVTSIPGVMLRVTGSAAAGSRGLFLKIRNGANTITSALKTFVFGNWSTQYHVAERAPDGSNWTKTSVDATESGQEVN